MKYPEVYGNKATPSGHQRWLLNIYVIIKVKCKEINVNIETGPLTGIYAYKIGASVCVYAL